MSDSLFKSIVERRRSVRVFDNNAPFDDSVVSKALSLAVLSANSSNMQLWEFYQVKTQSVHEALNKACMGQSAAKTANQLVVFVTRQDKWKERVKWNLANLHKQFEGKTLTKKDERALAYYQKLMPLVYRNDFFGLNTLIRSIIVFFMGFNKPFLRIRNHGDQRVMCHKSCALAAQTFMLSMASDGYDTCPMEGFDSDLVKKILKLPPAAEINMIIACGVGKPEGIYSDRIRVPNEEVIFAV
ncbi:MULTISPECIES: nitroreductase family protein [unclassified Arcicella]|uniref:nitroreductase family protein n=1 Tax=unclassified Arcicella TaxID=2644986 RepID=UPI002854D29D|nr:MULTISPECIES: nitroreductase family protein [unclassified Arcicella]MDR6560913.1 nitroreductase [Arcicella sp. BE51]MDR6810797.1 nitroreductase [Arcicella sp. BE140]MDR6822147.1 nitroreductase [Arcicella sp. BE139]